MTTREYNHGIKRMLICLGVFLLVFLTIGCIEQNDMDQRNTISNQSENEPYKAIPEEEETKMQISVQEISLR